ncbi:hypothetical protein [Planococcus lenghuensis]|uniref:DUF4181 domain-containing protein n=1 Tax=Planococcus lenghuensis TaxID=2213202 RepID=A0A1Q2KVH6_9BACL|nr:hypothetical protein [Planococcus lenghuensis]AQQ52114.1 hypothetical protein B0X71_02555 [Planococcus lenghuensis]
MNRKWLQGILLIGLSVTSLAFLIAGRLEVAVLVMTLLFVCTNAFRYVRMKEEGFDRGAKWMGGMAILFAVLFVIVLFTVVL